MLSIQTLIFRISVLPTSMANGKLDEQISYFINVLPKCINAEYSGNTLKLAIRDVRRIQIEENEDDKYFEINTEMTKYTRRINDKRSFVSETNLILIVEDKKDRVLGIDTTSLIKITEPNENGEETLTEQVYGALATFNGSLKSVKYGKDYIEFVINVEGLKKIDFRHSRKES